MSEKRYYYDNPIAARWMEQTFGMRFSHYRSERGEDVYDKGYGLQLSRHCPNAGRRYYIHPDSVHLLEPEQGDLVEGELFDDVTDTVLDEIDTYLYGEMPCCGRHASEPDRIIQRNGVPFHWPKVEEDA